jgi:BT1 family
MDLPYQLPQRSERKCGDYLNYPWRALLSYVRRMRQIFGTRFLAYLFLTQCLLKGIMLASVAASIMPWLKSLGVEAVHVQVFEALISSPWSVKPIIGAVSDLFPISGYHKRPWILMGMGIGLSGCAVLLATTASNHHLIPIVLGLTALHWDMATSDLLTEGKYAEEMRANPQTGSDLVTLVNGFQRCGDLVAMIYMGYIADHSQYLAFAIIMSVLAFIPVLPTIWGWLPEERRWRKFFHMDRSRWNQHKALLLVVLATGISGPIVAGIGTANRIASLIVSTAILLITVVGGYLAFPRIIANVALYQVLIFISRPNMGSAMDFFFTASPECVPNGPHFSFTYYITYTGIIGACMSFAAVWLYQLWMSTWRFRTVLVFTTALVGVSGILDFIILLRWNITYLGISDKAFYIVGESIVENMVLMLFWIPSSSIISKVCPPGLESATYAFLAGASNFARMVSSLSGAALFEAAGIKGQAPNCNFDHLPILVFLFHALLPVLVGIPAALWLIPNAKQTDELIESRGDRIERESEHAELELMGEK